MDKKEREKAKEYAQILFMNGEEIQTIAGKVGTTRQTVGKWAEEGGWKERRGAKNVTRPELVNKLLTTIDTLITSVNASGDAGAIAGLGDKLSKLSAVIQKLDKKANVVDTIEVFMAFSKWVEYRMQTDKDLTPELVKAFHKYQDIYITEKMNER